MPTEHVHITYNFDELSTSAQDKALEEVAEHLAGAWWDSSDNEAIEEAMLYALADKLQSPGYDAHGTADFPGIEGLKVEGWDLNRREYKLDGYLTPATAPALPWPPNGKQYVFSNRNSSAYLEVEKEDGEGSWTESAEPPAEFLDAIRDAIATALAAGQTEYDYKTGEEYAREWIDGNEPDFNDDGTLHH